MTTRKQDTSNASSTVSATNGTKARKRVAASPANRGRGRGRNVAAYAVPAAGVIATGVVGAAGYFFRRSLLHALKSATHETMTAARATTDLAAGAREQAMESAQALLHHLGLQRRTSSLMSVAGPALGVACGFIAGGVLTYFFAPTLLGKLGIGADAENDIESPEDPEVPAKRSASPTADGSLDHVAMNHANG